MKSDTRKLPHEDDLLTIRYVAPPSGVMEALQGWAVIVRCHDGANAIGVFEPFIPADGTEGMFQLTDVEHPEVAIFKTHIDNVKEVVVL